MVLQFGQPGHLPGYTTITVEDADVSSIQLQQRIVRAAREGYRTLRIPDRSQNAQLIDALAVFANKHGLQVQFGPLADDPEITSERLFPPAPAATLGTQPTVQTIVHDVLVPPVPNETAHPSPERHQTRRKKADDLQFGEATPEEA